MIKIVNLTKKYEDTKILDDISYSFTNGKVYSIIGCSGSGKSTFLKCLANLEGIDQGEIRYGDIKKNKIGFIFQNFNLFNNMTILDNIIYAPQKVLNIKKEEAIDYARKLLKKVNLDISIENKYPNSISGGQKQRVAIARTLCMKPKIILYDEPTSALDPENTAEVLTVIKDLSKSKGLLSIIVTHHMKFAESISDKIIFFENGKIIEENNAKDFFIQPKNKRLKEFLSKTSMVSED
ncbi:amino acid ABC transporter ATP-binding protein [Rickettsiales endosymbiont of Trichoplax sp. H2]|uniref:amino acid ABC transporter ATP-binding protein n=1 Tax=Rickettsiales endosymbiont of Trichoplax sp. H2 TaxID=2021221 RepID=UPI0012B3376A|nr:amino acid ABC transporter ATP-binding protein [Rickettsiales endosymbiont of Trichoplax sp. H2]MSO13870.1 Arginine transport ATP-binding protein ArtM [Rickettsiales endosymbiont of Trichoplax sp. H2]